MPPGWVVGSNEKEGHRPARRIRAPVRLRLPGRRRAGAPERRPAALPRPGRTRRRPRPGAVARPAPGLVRLAPRRPRPLPAGDDLGHRAVVPVAGRDRDRLADARAPRRRAAVRRGRRALSEPRPATRARLLPLPRRPRCEHRDLVRRQRLVGARVPRGLPRDRQPAAARRRRTGAALHRRRGLGPRRGRDLVEHASTRSSRGRRSPPTRCWRSCSTSRPARASRSRRRGASSHGRTPRA